MMALAPNDYQYIKLLEYGPFERRPRGGWRFGTRYIADRVVARLIASGRAAKNDHLVWLVRNEAAGAARDSKQHRVLAPNTSDREADG